jgi:hypothetical protein
VGLLIRDQPTLRDSIAVLIRYHAALNGSIAIMLEESAGVVVVREEIVVGAGVPVRQAIELAIGVLLRLMRRVLGDDWRPRRVCFMHPPPKAAPPARVRPASSSITFNGIVCSNPT